MITQTFHNVLLYVDIFTKIYHTVSMDRITLEEINDIAGFLFSLKDRNQITEFFKEILTEPEADTLSKRWQILKMLQEGKTQRSIARDLQVSLCKVTRGSKILKNKKSVISKYLKEIKNVSEK